MACSKLFSGDLPELAIKIIQHLRNDFNTLYYLALVNRFWCRLAIPLIWKNPFSIKYRGNLSPHFLDTYYLSLNNNDKVISKKIKSYKFNSNLDKPLFNYPSFIKTINFFRIRLHAKNWLTSYRTASTSSLTCLQNGSVEQMDSSCQVNENLNEGLNFIYTSLLKLFMENDASLNNLYANNYFLLNHFCDMVLKHPKFVSEIKILSFKYYYYRFYNPSNLKSVQIFLTLPSLPTTIKHIAFSSHTTGLKNLFSNIIKSQSQLSSVNLIFPKEYLEIPILKSLKHSSNTLRSVNFYSSQFSHYMRFDALSYLTQLESLQFRSCSGLNSNVIRPLLKITTPLKIKTLVIIHNGFAKLFNELPPIQLLIQKIGPYIENLVLSAYHNGLLFDTIIDFCEKVKFLHINNI